MVVPQISNPFFPLLVEAVERALRESGRELFLCDSEGSAEVELARVDALIGRQVDGLILVPSSAEASIDAVAVAQRYLPLVLLDRSVTGVSCDYVGVDHSTGIRLAVKHVASLGRTRFAFVSSVPSASAMRLRLDSYVEAVQDIDPAGVERIELGMFSAQFGREAAARLMALDNPPDAIICGADVVALGVMSELHALGFSIPVDVAVTGFDDIPFGEVASPGLTTVHQPTEALGLECVRLLEERIADSKKAYRISVFTPSLVVRSSTSGNLDAASARSSTQTA